MRKLATLFIVSLVLSLTPLQPVQAQDQEPSDPLDAQIEALMERMSTEEKVGQLFLVSFMGNEVGLESDIADLVVNYKVGGVVLSTANGNIINEGDTPTDVATMTGQLQALTQAAAQRNVALGVEPDVLTITQPQLFIPLFIAVEHEGDAYPHTDLINGFTPVPNNMAIGATWKTEHARTVGYIVGQELATVGVNVLLGPSLDVLDNPRPAARGDLGTRTFGGDPFWVGEMGQAYIKGVHQGSRLTPESEGHGRVAVVSKHFPGHGGSDRQANEEVSDVQKSLEQLKQIELAPFLAVTQPQDPLAQTDALMTAHISYRGFRGNLREQTKPISFDAQAMGLVMALPELAVWRQEGGVIFSDALGVLAVQRFFDPSLQAFNGKRIALDAFQAGNDVLYLSEYGLHGVATWETQLANMKDTIVHFRNMYEQDQPFRERVDASVRRILRLKFELYPNFNLETVQVDPAAAKDSVGQGRDQISQIAKDAITLIAPKSVNFIVKRPSRNDKIVIFTDDRQLPDQCPAPVCQPTPYYIPPDALADTLLRLYGPGEGATGEIAPENVQSFTFSELRVFLNPSAPLPQPTVEGETATPVPLSPVARALEQANLVIFAMLDVRLDNNEAGTLNAVKQFLDRRDDLIQEKRVIVLAYNSPYYLDTTEISKLDAYYGIYSRVEPFIEASIRALFGEGEFIPVGASPVSIEGINYDLLQEQTAPDPDQILTLSIHAVNGITLTQALEGTPDPTSGLELQTNDFLTLRTGVILDHNGHIVPDGTPVEFIFTYSPDEGGLPSIIQKGTQDGIAETEFQLERAEPLKIAVRSVDAHTSGEIRLNPGDSPWFITPTALPTSTPTMTPTPSPTPTPTSTSTPTPTATPTPTQTPVIPVTTQEPMSRVDGRDLVLVMIATLILGTIGFVIGRNNSTTVVGLRLFLWTWLLGMVSYTLYALGALEALKVNKHVGAWSALLMGVVGAMLPLVLYATSGQLRKRLRRESKA